MELSGEVEAGAIWRGAIANHLRKLAWFHRISLDICEDKRLLKSHYLFRVSGETEAVERFWRDWQRYMRDIDAAEQA